MVIPIPGGQKSILIQVQPINLFYAGGWGGQIYYGLPGTKHGGCFHWRQLHLENNGI